MGMVIRTPAIGIGGISFILWAHWAFFWLFATLGLDSGVFRIALLFVFVARVCEKSVSVIKIKDCCKNELRSEEA